MTSPVVASRTATLINTNTGLHTVNVGAPNVGDLLIVVSAFDSGDTADVIALDREFSGKRWSVTKVDTLFVDGLVAWKIAEGGGADALRYIHASASETSTHICIRVTGHGSAVAIASTSATSTNADPPNATISGSAQDLLAIAVACFDSTVTASAAPASYGNLTSQANGAGGGSISIADRAITAATSENPGAFTSTSEDWVAFTLLIPENAITTNGRTTQEAVEAISIVDAQMVATQVAIEAVSAFALNMAVTQVALETVTPQTQNMYATQVAMEVLSGDPWPSSGNANKYRQIQIAC